MQTYSEFDFFVCAWNEIPECGVNTTVARDNEKFLGIICDGPKFYFYCEFNFYVDGQRIITKPWSERHKILDQYHAHGTDGRKVRTLLEKGPFEAKKRNIPWIPVIVTPPTIVENRE